MFPAHQPFPHRNNLTLCHCRIGTDARRHNSTVVKSVDSFVKLSLGGKQMAEMGITPECQEPGQ